MTTGKSSKFSKSVTVSEYWLILSFSSGAGIVWDNFDGEAAGGISAEADLCGESGTKVIGARKGDLSQGLENRALARGLVSTDDNLWEGKDGIQTALSAVGDGIEDAAVLLALEVEYLSLYFQIGLGRANGLCSGRRHGFLHRGRGYFKSALENSNGWRPCGMEYR